MGGKGSKAGKREAGTGGKAGKAICRRGGGVTEDRPLELNMGFLCRRTRKERERWSRRETDGRRGTGHRASLCPKRRFRVRGPIPPPKRSSQALSNQTPDLRGSHEIKLPSSFDPAREEAQLRHGVIAVARGWSPSPACVKELLIGRWGHQAVERVRGVGGASFVIYLPEGDMRDRLIKGGDLVSEEGRLCFSLWLPSFGTLSGHQLWRIKMTGLPLHWLAAGCVGDMLASFGEVTEFLTSGLDGEGRSIKEVILKSPEGVTLPPELLVSHGVQKFRVGILATKMELEGTASLDERQTQEMMGKLVSRKQWVKKVGTTTQADSKEATVSTVWSEEADWQIELRRITSERQVEELSRLLAELHGKRLVPEEDDKILWEGDAAQRFTVKASYTWWMRWADDVPNMCGKSNQIWKGRYPLKVKIFVWMALQGRLLTKGTHT
ncbi:hypothetical protein QJS10_CPB14g00608 [Acorus calamus]|uniref:Reverse transcriptase zinc-binding domain-containing protein n=1 Tax=Acorus calamus TaxID=4465 RepID=A0AAV9DCP5_ACOCL|nr:hypothetical protein QJS10_CPB14g00608 [Acorus calamus]